MIAVTVSPWLLWPTLILAVLFAAVTVSDLIDRWARRRARKETDDG
jgi:uncharacterized membrane protein YgaE (UPF0421/DUF939 family)